MNKKTILTLSFFVLFYTIGCSSTGSYTVPEENKVLLPVEKKQAKRQLPNEDQLIMKALFLEEQGALKSSSELFALLYEKTNNSEYLLKEASTAHQANSLLQHLKELEEYTLKYPQNFQAQRLLLSFYLKQKNLNKAKEMGNKLIKNSNQAVDYELAANPYIFAGEYKKSITYLKEAYRKTLNEEILLKIITIKINYLNDVPSAIRDLEKHKNQQGCSEKICLQLINIYEQQSLNNKFIPLYKELYNKTGRPIYSEKIIESYLLNQQIDTAINYLETEKTSDTLLYALYMEKKFYDKANQLTKVLLQKTKNPKWYAESAISLYESLNDKDDKQQLQKVIESFEKYLASGEKNPVYLNYYGYTLIDKDLNIQKGIKAIEEALLQEPSNTYFLDSLAWGYYKLNNCEKAYPLMKQVVEVEGLNEEEIIQHWQKIHNKCKEK